MKSKENVEKYMVHGLKQVVKYLNLLVKNKCMVSASFDSSKYTFMTVLIKVLEDKELIVLDYGPDEKVNKKLTDGGYRAVFVTSFQGVKVQFSAEKVTRVKFKGETVFAAPIPDALLWLERREYYRVKALLSAPARCRIPLEDDESIELDVADISITGVALTVPADSRRLGDDIDTGSILSGSRLLLPDYAENIALEVRYRLSPTSNEGANGERVGCAFVDPPQSFQSNVLRYMQTVERHRKQLEK